MPSLRVYNPTPSAAEPVYKPFWPARHLVFNGDVLLFRRRGLIASAGRSVYSHAAMAGWWYDHLYCLELREFKGGRAVTLWSQVREFDGRIDVYRVNATGAEREKAFDKMRGKCGRPYDVWGVVLAAGLHSPFVRWVVRPDMDDNDLDRFRPEFCSQAVASAYHHGAGIDLVPNLADRITEPGDLGRALHYQFTFQAHEHYTPQAA